MENQTQIDIYILVGALAMFSLAMIVIAIFGRHASKIAEREAKLQEIEKEKQLEIFKAGAQAEENERQKIAKDLHDTIIPLLSVVERSVEANIKDYGTPSFDLERLKKDLRYIDQTVEDIRGISHDLVPETLLKLGCIAALKEFIEHISPDPEAVFENTTSFSTDIPFPLPEKLNIYRICLELVNNLTKHAQYKYLKVTLETTDNALEIVFMHNGKGVTNEEMELSTKLSTGLGLKSIMSRALMLKASINYFVEPEFAYVVLSVPFVK